ncbi:MAG: acyltransferase domain-containing protein, partial [Actinomycetota bacterium]|nr:acyltransferase domain-containing protein [Actinomycetota bacterium]
ADELRSFLAGTPTARTACDDASAPRARRVVLVCSGQGPQWWPLDPAVRDEPVVHATLTECDTLIRAETGWSLLEQLRTGELDGPDAVQPALFAVQVALAQLWRSRGITPDAVVGHSVGEVAAAHIAGALSLADAVRVVCQRGRLIRTVAGRGRMAVLELGADAARRALRGMEDRVSLAAVNSPASSVVSGTVAAVEELVARLSGEGVFCRIVESVDFASHSPQMHPLTADLVDALRDLAPTPTQVPMYSTVTGLVAEGDTLGGSYWAQNLRAPVQFATAVAGLLASDHDVFVELSPHPVLLPAIAQCTHREKRETVLLASLRRDEPPHDTALTSLGRLWTVGIDPDWAAVHPGPRRPVRLPSYPWQRERHWFDAGPGRLGLPVPAAGEHPLLGHHVGLADADGSHVWQGVLHVDASALLDDHRVAGAAVIPAAVWLEMARAAAEQALRTDTVVLSGVQFRRMLVVPDAGAATTQVRVRPADGGWSTVDAYARGDAGSAWTRHVSAGIAPADPADGERCVIDLDAVRARCSLEVTGPDHYDDMSSRGLEYGPTFRVVERLWRGEREALAAVAPVPGPVVAGYAVHPALLDAALQTLHAARAGDVVGATAPEVPVTIDRVTIRPAGRVPSTDGHLLAHARLRPDDAPLVAGAVGDVWLTDGVGTIVAALEGVHARPVGGGHLTPALHTVRWERRDRPAAGRAGSPD